MTAPVFVDTSAWYAVCDRRDGNHAPAAAYLAKASGPLLTTNLVFSESLSLVTKRLGKEAAIRFGAGLRESGRLRIIHVDARMEEAAWELFRRYADKDWDLVDCSSLVLIESLGLRTAFTFDSRFAQRGIETAPA